MPATDHVVERPIRSREVEEMICRLPPVSEVAGIGLADPSWVDAVTTVIVLKAGQSLGEFEVMAYCSERMVS